MVETDFSHLVLIKRRNYR